MKKKISKILSAFSITILMTLLTTFTCAFFFDIDILDNIVSILRNGYITNTDWTSNQFWPDNLNNEKANVSTVDFLILNEEEILNRYNASTIRAIVTDSTKNSETVYAWYEKDPTDNSKYKMFVACKNTIYFPEISNGMFQDFANLTRVNFNDAVNTKYVINMNKMFYNNTNLQEINGIDNFNTSKLQNMAQMFENCGKITTLDLSKWNTSSLVTMQSAFRNMALLENINLSNWNTSKVTDISCLFLGNGNLTEIAGIEDFNTTNVKYINWIFQYCAKLTSLNLSKWNTSNANEMQGLFYDCTNLKDLNVSNWNVSKVENFNFLFHGASSLTNLDLSSWDVSNAVSFREMFRKMTSLETLNLSGWNTEKATNMLGMFLSCDKLKNLDVSSFKTPSVTNFNYMFQNMTSLEELNASNMTIGSALEIKAMFQNNKAKKIDISSMDFVNSKSGLLYEVLFSDNTDNAELWLKNCENVEWLLDKKSQGIMPSAWTNKNIKGKGGNYCPLSKAYSVNLNTTSISTIEAKVRTVKYEQMTKPVIDENLKTANDNNLWHANITDTTKDGAEVYAYATISTVDPSLYDVHIVSEAEGIYLPENSSDTFRNLAKSLVEVDFGNARTDLVNYFTTMFYGCSELKNIKGIENFDTSNAVSFSYMFQNCSNLTSLDLSKWDTSNVVSDMAGIFLNCTNLKELNVSTWDVSNVKSFNSLFEGAKELTTLDLSKWKTINATSMTSTFKGMTSIVNLDLSGWDTSKVTNMHGLFLNDNNLTTITGIEDFDTSNVNSMSWIFQNCAKLTSLDLSKWDTSNVKSDMWGLFYGCTSLKELNVSTWDVSNVEIFNSLFFNTASLTSVGVENWDMSSAKDICNMFGSSGITSLDLSKWDTTKVTNMDSVFQNMQSLESLNLTGWKTENVTTMTKMFLWDTKLKQLDVSSFNTSKVTDFSFMFQHMNSLEELNASNMTIKHATSMWGMFQNQEAIKTIDISSMDFINTENAINYTNLFQITNDGVKVKVSSCQTADWILNNLTRGNDFPDTWKAKNFEYPGECPVRKYNVAKMDIASTDLLTFNSKSQISEASVKIYNEDGNVVDNIYAKVKLQGTSSLQYEKKNYTITFYADKNYLRKQDVMVNSAWGGQNKYCLKANWIDSTQARNVVTARLTSEIQAKYGLFPDTPNNGLIDGFFVELYVNGEYLGLYTMNIPKDEWMFGMDSKNENHIVFAAENPNKRSATTFETLAEVEDGKDFSIEAGPNETPEEVASSFEKLNRLIAFVKDSTNEEFKENLKKNKYLNLDAVINYYIMMFISGGIDNMNKNMLLVTYDGETWYPSLYDLDSTWGIFPDGKDTYAPDKHPTQYYGGTSLLFKKLVENFPQEVQARYNEIREIMTKEHIINAFDSFINTATPEMWQREHDKWPDIPSSAYTLDTQIIPYIEDHLKYTDSVMDQLYVPLKTYSDPRIKFDLEEPYVGEKYKFKDTGVNIYQDESINYTIFAQVKSSGIKTNYNPVIFSNRNKNYAGMRILSDPNNVDQYKMFFLGPNNGKNYDAIYKPTTKEYSNIIVVKQGDTYRVYHDAFSHETAKTTFTLTNPMGTEKVDTNLIIGADFNKDDFLAEFYSGETTSDYYTGVINKFTIYEGVLSDEEIKSLLES